MAKCIVYSTILINGTERCDPIFTNISHSRIMINASKNNNSTVVLVKLGVNNSLIFEGYIKGIKKFDYYPEKSILIIDGKRRQTKFIDKVLSQEDKSLIKKEIIDGYGPSLELHPKLVIILNIAKLYFN